jgi:hypothetical protein
MRSYFKAYQTFQTITGRPPNDTNTIVIPQYSDTDNGGEAVYVQFGVGLKFFHVAMINSIWQASADFAVNPPGYTTSGTCNLCTVTATGGMDLDPAHILDFCLVGPYARHPLN